MAAEEQLSIKNEDTEQISEENGGTEQISTENEGTEQTSTGNEKTEQIATENEDTEQISTENEATELISTENGDITDINRNGGTELPNRKREYRTDQRSMRIQKRRGKKESTSRGRERRKVKYVHDNSLSCRRSIITRWQ